MIPLSQSFKSFGKEPENGDILNVLAGGGPAPCVPSSSRRSDSETRPLGKSRRSRFRLHELRCPNNPLNPANRYNPTTLFQPLTPSRNHRLPVPPLFPYSGLFMSIHAVPFEGPGHHMNFPAACYAPNCGLRNGVSVVSRGCSDHNGAFDYGAGGLTGRM